MTVLTVDSTYSKWVVLEVMRKMTAENMFKKPVINTNPHAFMECLHPISWVGYIQYTVDKIKKKSHMSLLFMLYFLAQQNLSHYLNVKMSLLGFRIPYILDAIKGTDLKSETRLNVCRVCSTVTILHMTSQKHWTLE